MPMPDYVANVCSRCERDFSTLPHWLRVDAMNMHSRQHHVDDLRLVLYQAERLSTKTAAVCALLYGGHPLPENVKHELSLLHDTQKAFDSAWKQLNDAEDTHADNV